MPSAKPVLTGLSALADPLRSRILLLLEGQELNVSEICSVVQVPQSTASRQLKVLAGDGWVTSRAAGTTRWYSMTPDRAGDGARKLWALVRGEIAESSAARQDRQRLAAVLAERRARSQEFFAESAADWDRRRGQLFGEEIDHLLPLALLDDDWIVGDLGCGTGRLSAALAPFVAEVVAVDDSEAMLRAAAARLAAWENVRIVPGSLEELPLEDGGLDAAMICLVLHYVVEPLRALSEARRVLRPGGRLLIVDMLPHDREEYRAEMGHVWLGFAEEQLEAWLDDAGFERMRYRLLPAEPRARGPALFAAAARAPAAPLVRGNGMITELDF